MSEQDWEVVNTKQKKQQKNQKKKEDKETQKKRELQEKQEEERRRKETEEAFLQQYVNAKTAQNPASSGEETSVANPYDAFKVLEKKQRKLAQNDMLLPADDSSDEETGGSKKKKKASKPKAKKPSVIKVAKQIDNKQLKEILAQYPLRYPDNPEIQLKNLAEQFETIFNTADTKKSPSTLDTPYSLLEKDVIDTVSSFLTKSPEDSLVVYFWFLLTTLISVQKTSSTSGIGLKLLLQIISKHFPHILLKNLNSIKTLQLNTCFDTIMYVFNQLLTEKSVRNGFAAWFHVLLPLVLENKTSNQNKEEIIKYFERLMELSKNTNAIFRGDEAAGANAYERIFQEKSLPERIAKHKGKLLDTTFLFGKDRVPKKTLYIIVVSRG